MKARDLMIGDWVNIYVFPNRNPKKKDLFPAQITAILSADDTGEHVECVYRCKGGGLAYASRPASTCLPIPLTVEILEKNGFSFLGCYEYEYKDGSCFVDILNVPDESESGEQSVMSSVYIDGPHFRITITIEYVHELQHALRLCGVEKEIEL